MKNSPLFKTGLRLLVIAGALTPFTTISATSMVAAGNEGAFYDNLRQIQATHDSSGSMHGAQGPIRNDFVEPTWSSDESSLYDNLRKLQEAPKPMEAMRGARGPVREDFMTPAWSSHEVSTYENLRIIQAN